MLFIIIITIAKIARVSPLLLLLLFHCCCRVPKAVEACAVAMSSANVDCALRGYWIQPDAVSNQTALTVAINNLVYGTSSDATIWTVSRRLAFNSYWNAIRQAIWDNTNYPTMDVKINRIVFLLNAYSSNVCSFQAYFYATPVCAAGIAYGLVGDFVACGNVPSTYKLPAAKPVTTAPVGVDANGCPIPLTTPSTTTTTSTASTSTSTTTSTAASSTTSSTTTTQQATITTAPACTCPAGTIAEVFGNDAAQFKYYDQYVQTVCPAEKCPNSFTKGCFTNKGNQFADYYFSQVEIRCTDWTQFCACPLNGSAAASACLTFSKVVPSDCTPGTADCPWLGLDTYCQTANDPTTCATYMTFHGTCDCSGGTVALSTLTNAANTRSSYTCCDGRDDFQTYGNVYVPFTVQPSPFATATHFAVSCSGCAPIQTGSGCPT